MIEKSRSDPGTRPTPGDWSERFDSLLARLEGSRRRGLPVQADHGVAGRWFSFRAASERALATVIRPIEHLPSPDPDAPRLSIQIGDGADDELDEFLSSSGSDPGETKQIRPRLVLGNGRDMLGAAWPATGMLGWLDRRSDRAVVWLREPARLSIADAATLIRSLVAWWMADNQRGVVHAAAVVGARGAALLTGRGGTGKSSSAAACFLAGLRFIGDDSVFCRADTAEVFSLNTCVSLSGPDLALYYAGLDREIDGTPGSDGKVIVDLAEVDRSRVVSSASLCAIVSLVRRPSGPVEIRPVSRGRVLASLAPSSVFNVPTPEPRTLSMVAELVRRLPTFELALCGDRAEVAVQLRRFLDGGLS